MGDSYDNEEDDVQNLEEEPQNSTNSISTNATEFPWICMIWCNEIEIDVSGLRLCSELWKVQFCKLIQQTYF